MKRGVLSVGIGFCLLVVSSGAADIIRTIENPPNNQEVSGISLVSGWAFATTGIPVAIRVVVDGEPAETIACCSSRADVKVLFPVAPLQTGFGLLFNFNDRFAIGSHTIAVTITAGNESVTETRQITVAKPGGRVGENRLTFGFLSDLDASTAASAVDSTTEELILAPVTVMDKKTGIARQSTLRLAWRGSLQSFVTVGAASGTEFAAVQSIFTSKCTSCHGGNTPAANLDLSEGHAFQQIVPVKSAQDKNRLLVNPGEFSSSYVYQKVITGGSIAAGTKRMPPDCSGATCLSDSQIDTLKTWIITGAPPPQ